MRLRDYVNVELDRCRICRASDNWGVEKAGLNMKSFPHLLPIPGGAFSSTVSGVKVLRSISTALLASPRNGGNQPLAAMCALGRHLDQFLPVITVCGAPFRPLERPELGKGDFPTKTYSRGSSQ